MNWIVFSIGVLAALVLFLSFWVVVLSLCITGVIDDMKNLRKESKVTYDHDDMNRRRNEKLEGV